MEFTECERGEISDLYTDHMDSICEPWELYIEIMAKPSQTYVIISDDGQRMGFVLVDNDGVMFQFHLLNRFVPIAEEVFSKVLEDLGVAKAVCQTFDHLFLAQCLLHMKKRKIIGYNFRERIDPPSPITDRDLVARRATMDDKDLFREFSDGIFTEEEIEDIPYWIERSTCMIFEDLEGKFIGYGMLNRTLPDRDWYDVGMYVRKEKRKQGFGTFIIDRMADMAKEIGGRPCAGCDFNNTGSKRTLERAGFISRHNIIEFEF